MASDGPSPSFPPLRLGLTTPQPSRCHHTQSLLAPSFHDPKMPHVIESPVTPSRAFLPPRRSATTCCRLSLRPCTALSCNLQPLLKLSLFNLGPSVVQFVSIVHFCWITETQFLNLCVYLYLFLFCLCFSDRNDSELQQGFSKGGNVQTVRHTAETHVDKERTGSGLWNAKKEGIISKNNLWGRWKRDEYWVNLSTSSTCRWICSILIGCEWIWFGGGWMCQFHPPPKWQIHPHCFRTSPTLYRQALSSLTTIYQFTYFQTARVCFNHPHSINTNHSRNSPNHTLWHYSIWATTNSTKTF